MVGAGTIINPLLKVVTTVAILAAVYFFIVKPSLETTEKISSGINSSIDESINDTNEQVERALRRSTNGAAGDAQRQIQEAIRESGAAISQGGGEAAITDANRLLECIQAANGDVNQMAACQP